MRFTRTHKSDGLARIFTASPRLMGDFFIINGTDASGIGSNFCNGKNGNGPSLRDKGEFTRFRGGSRRPRASFGFSLRIALFRNGMPLITFIIRRRGSGNSRSRRRSDKLRVEPKPLGSCEETILSGISLKPFREFRTSLTVSKQHSPNLSRLETKLKGFDFLN